MTKTTDKNSNSTFQELPPNLEFWEGSSIHVKQGRHWSSAIIWITTTLFGTALIWGFNAKIDQSITVFGRLQPSGSVRDVDSPTGGVISEVFVSDGDIVDIGTPLFTVQAKGLASRRDTLMATQRLFTLQAQSLKAVLLSNGDPSKFLPQPSIPQTIDPDERAQYITAIQQSLQLRSQLQQLSVRITSRSKTLKYKELIARDLKPLYEGGGMSRNQYFSQLDQIQQARSSILALSQERTKIIGEAARQLNAIDRQLLNIKSELIQLKENIDYRTVNAPSQGRIFNSDIALYSVINADQTVLKIVPENKLEAVVSISNSDIGFVKLGMPVTVSVESFPSGEFGYINGVLTSIGSDALKPDQENPSYRFPASISLDQQSVLSGEQELNLQSGMSITANLKLRSRPIISIVSDLFVKQLDGVKRFR